MSKTLFSHELRVLACEHCGAPIEVDVTGGSVKCDFCQTPHVIVRRDETVDLAETQRAVATEISEEERFHKLR